MLDFETHGLCELGREASSLSRKDIHTVPLNLISLRYDCPSTVVMPVSTGVFDLLHNPVVN